MSRAPVPETNSSPATADVTARRRSVSMLRTVARASFVVAAVVLLVLAVYRDREGFGDALAALDGVRLAIALGAAMAGALINMLAWRASMAAVGVPVPLVSAARVFYVSQLGKYIPGSIWPVVAQVELTRDTGVSRVRGVAGVLLAMVIAVVTSTAIACGLLVLPDPDVRSQYWWLLAVLPLAAAALHPVVLRRLLTVALRVTRRTTSMPALHGRHIVTSVLWSASMWVVLGFHTWLLGDQVSSGGLSLRTAIGGFALAWAAGFVAVVVPAGLGVREAALALALSSVLSPADALAVALVSRVLMTVADGLAAATAVAVHAWIKPTWQHSPEPPEPPEPTATSAQH